MSDREFFEERTPSSKRKADIIVKFFKGWASVVGRTAPEFLYIDLYAGRGYYDRCLVDPTLPKR